MPPDQPLEQEIQFRKRARRRLVGAIALVLLMVTILPMVLDDRAVKSPQQEIVISIPSQDGAEFASKVVPVGPTTLEPQLEEVPVEAAIPAQKTEPAKLPEKSPDKLVHAVTPAPETQKTASAQKLVDNANSGAYTVQIGVFSDPANVKKLQQKLQTLGYKSYTEMVDTPKGEKIRLRAGPFSNHELADNALTSIKGAGLSGLVVLNK